MRKQRFNIIPVFCNETNRHGFKFVDTEQELGETNIFFTMQESSTIFREFIPKMKKFNYSIERALEITREFNKILIDQIIKLPIPPVSYANKDDEQILKDAKSYFESLIFSKQSYEAIQEWTKKTLCKEIFVFTPSDFSSAKNPWVIILIPPQKQLSSEEMTNIFKKLESKQQARELLEKELKEEAINKEDYILTLSKINNLENLPEQTHQEKMDSISKQN